MKRVLLSWSSGKDSAWTLHVLRADPAIEVIGLLTTLNAEFDRVAMHGTRRTVLEAQAAAAKLPLWIVPLPWPCTNEIYEQRMAEACARAVSEKIDAIAFGDLFLTDVRAYRERQLAGTGIEPLFPLWEIPTDALARAMIAGGLRARLACVDTKQLPAQFAGRDFDAALLAELPAAADPCGERGEFHTCVYAGPCLRLHWSSAQAKSSTATVSPNADFRVAALTAPATRSYPPGPVCASPTSSPSPSPTVRRDCSTAGRAVEVRRIVRQPVGPVVAQPSFLVKLPDQRVAVANVFHAGRCSKPRYPAGLPLHPTWSCRPSQPGLRRGIRFHAIIRGLEFETDKVDAPRAPAPARQEPLRYRACVRLPLPPRAPRPAA